MNRYIYTFILLLCTMGVSHPHVFCSTNEINSVKVENDFRAVAKKAIPAVVSITVKGEEVRKTSNSFQRRGSQDPFNFFGDDFFQQFFFSPGTPSAAEKPSLGQGSGFIVSPDGYIVTNSHVVSEAAEIKVTLNDSQEFIAKLIGNDASTDIALIKIDAANLPYLHFGNSDDLEVGQWVVAIGNTFGLQASLTVGIVSAKGRNNLDITRIEDFIQTDAAINRGNSGGPLLNLNSEVVGVNTAIVTNATTGGYMGIGFAIPSNIAKHDFEELRDHGAVERGFLGVGIQQIDKDLATAFGLDKTEGALVTEVQKNSPAEKAGIKTGDVILKLNQQPIANIAALRNAISLMKPKTRVTLTVLRKDKTREEISLEVGNFPSEVAHGEMIDSKLGIEVQNLTPELSRSLGYNDDKGIVITNIAPGSIAAWAGLKKGAIIMAVNHQQVNSVEQFKKALETTEKGKPVLFLIKQDDLNRFVSLKVN